MRDALPQPGRAGTSLRTMRCSSDGRTEGAVAETHIFRNEATMATRQDGRIVETPTEARQAEPGPSVLALLTASTGLAILILGIVWFVFFRT
jgi:hypothetical protein